MIKKIVVSIVLVAVLFSTCAVKLEASKFAGFIKFLKDSGLWAAAAGLIGELMNGGGSSQPGKFKPDIRDCNPIVHGEGKAELVCISGTDRDCTPLPCMKKGG